GGVEVRRVAVAEAPEGVSIEDGARCGQWIAGVLREAGFAKSKLVLSVPRADVVLKRLSLPVSEETDEGDLAGAVALQMGRQLAVSAEGALIDYVPMKSGLATPDSSGHPSLSVMAAAIPGDRASWFRGLGSGIGWPVRRIGIRGAGTAAMLTESSIRQGAGVLGVTLGRATAEFVVVEDGAMTLARSVDVGLPRGDEEREGFAERLSVEAKRTWASHRAGSPGLDLGGVTVLGAGETARLAGESCGKQLEASWSLTGLPSRVTCEATISPDELTAVAPLAGLLYEWVLGGPTLDFASPRRAPDRSARVRKAALLGVLGLVVFGGGGVVLSNQRLSALEGEVTQAQGDAAGKAREYEAFLVQHARLSHIETWRASGVQWLPHVSAISERFPPTNESILNALTGHLRASAEYVPGGTRYPGGVWQPVRDASLSIEGTMKSRAVATALRETLVQSELYRVESKGADVADRFDFELSTSMALPEKPPAKAGDKSKGGGPPASDQKQGGASKAGGGL
ncbi:MAG: hypothetical protein JNL50_07730, partial [Phycisphaerae bacterium]|nr:hypothetical protein [Phycisphaerae bacterium]